MEKVTEALEKLNVSVTKLTERVANLESSAEAADATTRQSEPSTRQAGVSLDPTRGQVFTPEPHSYLRDFDQLKDKLSKIPLPPHLKLSDSSAGIKAESKPVTKVIAKAARFGETGLKLLAAISSSQEGDSEPGYHLTDEDIGSLYTIFAAQIQYMQQEYAGIIVKNTFDDETSRLFRQFENHTSAFSASQLENVRVAAELASISSRRNSERGRGRGDRNFNSSGRGRGFGGGFGSGFGSGRGGGYSRLPGPGHNGGFLSRHEQPDRRD